MSVTKQTTRPDESPSENDDGAETLSKQERLHSYLATEAAEQGELYVKSKFIADDVGLSSKEIGALMVKLSESAPDLQIEKWSYTSATTWRIALA